MSEVTFVGVKNVSGAKCNVMHDGEIIHFAKDETKVVPAHLGRHILARIVYSSKKVEVAGEEKSYLEAKRTFQSVPLAEALQHVKEPENKSVAAAKRSAEIEERKESEMENRVILRLQKAGWKPPERKEEPPVKGKL